MYLLPPNNLNYCVPLPQQCYVHVCLCMYIHTYKHVHIYTSFRCGHICKLLLEAKSWEAMAPMVTVSMPIRQTNGNSGSTPDVSSEGVTAHCPVSGSQLQERRAIIRTVFIEPSPSQSCWLVHFSGI